MKNPFRLLGSRRAYESPIFAVREDFVEKPGGKCEPFAVVEMKSGATVVALTDDEQVYLVREYKYAIAKTSLEAPSGGIDFHETPLEAAKRELREEVGIAAAEWTDLGYIDPFTTQLVSPSYLFLARNLAPVQQDPDEGEILQVVKVPFAEAVSKVLRSEITHAGSCVAILRADAWLKGWRS